MDNEEQVGSSPNRRISFFRRLFMCLLVFSASIFVLTMPEEDNLIGLNNLVENQVVGQTIYSRCEFQTDDFERTRWERERVANSVPLYFKRLDDVSGRMLNEIVLFFSEVERRKTAESKRQDYLHSEAGQAYMTVKELSPADFAFFSRVAEDEAEQKELIQKINDQVLNKGILSDAERKRLPANCSILIFDMVAGKVREFTPEPMKNVLSENMAGAKVAEILLPMYSGKETEDRERFRTRTAQLFSNFFSGGNLRETEEKTKEAQAEQRNNVKMLKKIIHNGDVLFSKEHKVNKEDLQLISDYQNAYQLQSSVKSSWGSKVKKWALSLVFLIFAVLYLRTVHVNLFKNDRQVSFLVVIAILALLLNRLSAGVYCYISEFSGLPPRLIYLSLPLGLASGLIAAICGLRAAVCVGLFVSGIATVALNDSFDVVATGLLVSGTVAVAVKNVSDYKRFFLNMFFACVIPSIFTSMIFFMDEIASGEWPFLRDVVLIATLSCLLTAIVTMLCLFILESVTDFSTNMTFLYYTNRNHPLLKQLQLEAPGTYHHSERVASIAEKAANQIGANPLQIQACALFHDIGKLSAPGMFTENTAETSNPHQTFSPQESVAIIRKHVTYGLELAKQKKLKKAFLDAIAQHHGTDFISFFYDLAKKNSEVPPDEKDFRYPGPLPDTKETVILAIADFSEAVSRSMPNLNKQELKVKIWDILRKKQEKGQLDHAPVTLYEIHLIVDSLVDSLISMNHTRIAYPTFNKDNKK